MFKKATLVSLVLAATSNLAFADPYYKGMPMGPTYKGAVSVCRASCFQASPYFGGSIGSRNNYASNPAVFRGVDGNVFIGFGGVIDTRMYLAGEGYVNKTWIAKDMPNAGVSAKTRWGWGVSLLPGILVNPRAVVYARFGITRQQFHSSDNVYGFQLGPGAEISVAPNVGIRGEYLYTKFNTTTNLGKPSADIFNLGVVFRLF
jgi:opacity protein-like surface antigen